MGRRAAGLVEQSAGALRMTIDERGTGRPSRRAIIRTAAAAGAAAWTAPVILDSLVSPAAAATGDGFPCSYAMVVFTMGGNPQKYVVKINKATTTCLFTNTTSGDATFSFVCNGTYDNTGDGNRIQHNNVTIPASTVGCPFTVDGSEVTANPGVNILFVALHDGTFPNKFDDICNPDGSFDAGPFGCTGAD